MLWSDALLESVGPGRCIVFPASLPLGFVCLWVGGPFLVVPELGIVIEVGAVLAGA